MLAWPSSIFSVAITEQDHGDPTTAADCCPQVSDYGPLIGLRTLTMLFRTIGALFDIERGINGLAADERLRIRKEQSARRF